MPQFVLLAAAGAGAYVAYRVAKKLIAGSRAAQRAVDERASHEPRDLGRLRADKDGIFRPE